MSATKYAYKIDMSKILKNSWYWERCCPEIILHKLLRTFSRSKFLRLDDSPRTTFLHLVRRWPGDTCSPSGRSPSSTFPSVRPSPWHSPRPVDLRRPHYSADIPALRQARYITAPVLRRRYADGLLFLSNYRRSLILSRSVTHKCRVSGQPLASPENSATYTPRRLCWTFCLGGRGFVCVDPRKLNNTALISSWKNLIVDVAMETQACFLYLAIVEF